MVTIAGITACAGPLGLTSADLNWSGSVYPGNPGYSGGCFYQWCYKVFTYGGTSYGLVLQFGLNASGVNIGVLIGPTATGIAAGGTSGYALFESSAPLIACNTSSTATNTITSCANLGPFGGYQNPIGYGGTLVITPPPP